MTDEDNEQKARKILALLQTITEEDRLGFLFGMLIGLMRKQGLSRIEIEKHLEYGLAEAFKEETS